MRIVRDASLISGGDLCTDSPIYTIELCPWSTAVDMSDRISEIDHRIGMIPSARFSDGISGSVGEEESILIMPADSWSLSECTQRVYMRRTEDTLIEYSTLWLSDDTIPSRFLIPGTAIYICEGISRVRAQGETASWGSYTSDRYTSILTRRDDHTPDDVTAIFDASYEIAGRERITRSQPHSRCERYSSSTRVGELRDTTSRESHLGR